MRPRKLVADLTSQWRKVRQFTLRASAACAVVLVGCAEDVDSTSIRTSGIYAEFQVVGNGDGRSLVEMRLTVGGQRSNTYLRLKGRDRLVVDADGEIRPVRQREDQFDDSTWYTASASLFTSARAVRVSTTKIRAIQHSELRAEIRQKRAMLRSS